MPFCAVAGTGMTGSHTRWLHSTETCILQAHRSERVEEASPSPDNDPASFRSKRLFRKFALLKDPFATSGPDTATIMTFIAKTPENPIVPGVRRTGT